MKTLVKLLPGNKQSKPVQYADDTAEGLLKRGYREVTPAQTKAAPVVEKTVEDAKAKKR